MSNNRKEEIDLFIAIDKAKESYRLFIISILRTLKRIFKLWYVLLAVILLGILLGYYQQKNLKRPYTSTLLVQMNFKSTNTVYNAVEQLDEKLKKKKATMLQELQIDSDEIFKLESIEVSPIVNILDIMENANSKERNVEVLLKESQIEDDLLTSEMFLQEYKTHKITVLASSEASRETVDVLMNYLNNNELYSQLKEVAINNTKLKIEELKTDLASVDSVMGAYGTSPIKEGGTNRIFLNTGNITNVHLLLEEKELIVDKLLKAEMELKKYNSTVTLLNSPVFYEEPKSILDRKMVLYPIAFSFMFVFLVWFIGYYKKLQEISNNTI